MRRERREKIEALGSQILEFYESPTLERIEQLTQYLDLSFIELSGELYNTHLQYPDISIRRLCSIVSSEIPARSARFFQSLIHIHKHFIIKCRFYNQELIGIDYRFLKCIAESADGLFDRSTTVSVMDTIKNNRMSTLEVWAYIKDVRSDRQRLLSQTV